MSVIMAAPAFLRHRFRRLTVCALIVLASATYASAFATKGASAAPSIQDSTHRQPTPPRTLHAPTPSPTRTSFPDPTHEPKSDAWGQVDPPVGEPFVIGTSAAGRPLEVLRFGNGDSSRMVVAGIHGGYEWNTIALADQLIVHLTQHADLVPPEVTLYVLRSLNPDGEAQGHGYEGRANANGVDLNRNWPVQWLPEWPRSGCWNFLPISAGPLPTSEPETQALMRFVLRQHVEALVSYHSAAPGVYPGGQPPEARSVALAEVLAAASGYPYPPAETGCLFSGQLIDWASASGIAAVDVELTAHWATDFDRNLALLTAFLRWTP